MIADLEVFRFNFIIFIYLVLKTIDKRFVRVITNLVRRGVVVVTLLHAFNPVVELSSISNEDALFAFLVCLFLLVIGDVLMAAVRNLNFRRVLRITVLI